MLTNPANSFRWLQPAEAAQLLTNGEYLTFFGMESDFQHCQVVAKLAQRLPGQLAVFSAEWQERIDTPALNEPISFIVFVPSVAGRVRAWATAQSVISPGLPVSVQQPSGPESPPITFLGVEDGAPLPPAYDALLRLLLDIAKVRASASKN